jgi:hypothetical protein
MPQKGKKENPAQLGTPNGFRLVQREVSIEIHVLQQGA